MIHYNPPWSGIGKVMATAKIVLAGYIPTVDKGQQPNGCLLTIVNEFPYKNNILHPW